MTRRALGLAVVVVLGAACGGGGGGTASGPAKTGGGPASPAGSASTGVAAVPSGTGPGAQPPSPPPTPGAPSNAAGDSPQAIGVKYGGATVTPQARAQALAEIGAIVEGNPGGPIAQREATLVAALKARPEIEDAGNNPGLNVWARFKDGKQILVTTYDFALPGGRHAEAAPRTRPHAARAKAVPEPTRAQLFDSFSFDASVIAELPGWMKDKAYEPYALGSTATVEALKSTVKGDGFFYLNTHGGMGWERNTNILGDHPQLYSLMTGSPVRDKDGKPIRAKVGGRIYDMDAGAAAYEDDLSDGSLTYFLADVRRTDGTKCKDADGKDTTWCIEWRYGMTHRFVHKYFELGANSLVFLNACSSVSDKSVDLDAELAGKGAGLVVGWSNVIEATTAMRAAEVVIDRMLGENKMHIVPPSTPPQRPWSFLPVYKELVAKGWDHYTDENNDAHMATVPPGGDALLVPSIATLDVDEAARKIWVQGDFGDDPGDGKRQVTIAATSDPSDTGSALGGCTWRPDTIECDIGDDQAGWVKVSARGHASNPVALTRFHPILTFTFDGTSHNGGEIHIKSVLDAKIRIDLQPWRRSPQEDPRPRDPFRVSPVQSSTCRIDVHGFGIDDHGNRKPITGSTTMVVAGPYPSVVPLPGEGGAGPLGLPPGVQLPPGVNIPPQALAAAAMMPDPMLLAPAPVGKCTFGGKLDLTQQPAPTTDFAWSIHPAPYLRGDGWPEPVPELYTVHDFIKKDGAQPNPADIIKQLTLHLQLAFAPQGGSATLLGGHLDQQSSDGRGKLRLEWADTNGEYPPDPHTGR
jgi:hypothetical protein